MKKSGERLRITVIYVALALATFIAFEQVCRNGFLTYDDDVYVTENPNIKAGITTESVIWAFTSTYAANWHPLTWFSHMLDYQLFGLRPFWHHLVNLLLHIANSLLLFWLLSRMTGAIWRSVFVAALFALHPIHVESVAWLAERKDVLCGLFWMVTMVSYIRYAERLTIGRYLLVLLSLCLGLMAKATLVTLPFVLCLLDYWPLRRFQLGDGGVIEDPAQCESSGPVYQQVSARRLIMEKIPMFVVVALSSVITVIAQRSGGAVVSMEKLSIGFRLSNAGISYIRYILKMLYPIRLALFYPHPTGGIPLWQFMISLLILVVISVLFIYTLRRHKYLTVGWLWYLGTMVPVIGLVQVGLQAMADRYTYLSSIGFFIMIAWSIEDLTARLHFRKTDIAVSAAVVLALLFVCTRRQVMYWRNDLALFGHTVRVTRNNYIMHNSYGSAFLKAGRVNEAMMQFNRALQIHPDHFDARNNLGGIFLRQGRINEAISCFTELLNEGMIHASVYSNLGQAYARIGQIDRAIGLFQQALEIEPGEPGIYTNLGQAYFLQGKVELAIQMYNEALRIDPDNPYALKGLASVLQKQRQDGAEKR
jgi:Tfp pilus assembly protein PilF